jgi:hypothetical protein
MNEEEAESAEFKQKKRNGIMEQWNNGMVGNTIGFPIFQHSNIPTFQHSNFPSFLSVCSATSVVKFFY